VAALRLSGRNARLCAPQRFIGRSPQVETRLLLFFSLFNGPQTGSITPKRPAVRAIRERLGHAPAQRPQDEGSVCTGESRSPTAGCVERARCGALSARGCDRVCIPRCAPQSPADDAGSMVDLDSIPHRTSAEPHGRLPTPLVHPSAPAANPGFDHRGLEYTHRPTNEPIGACRNRADFAWLSGCPVRSWLGAAVSLAI
jgi:hypothetical protein